jgi:hypothetical protein
MIPDQSAYPNISSVGASQYIVSIITVSTEPWKFS